MHMCRLITMKNEASEMNKKQSSLHLAAKSHKQPQLTRISTSQLNTQRPIPNTMLRKPLLQIL
jgi:hypothetical protein